MNYYLLPTVNQQADIHNWQVPGKYQKYVILLLKNGELH